MANVRFYSGTRAKYDSLVIHNPLALYFCDDTGELFKGDICLSDAIRIVPTKADLPSHALAASGIVYFVAETKSGFMISPDRTEWLQTIYAPITDAYSIPEEEMYTTVTTVGAVRDIEAKIYKRIEEVANGGALSKLKPVDGTIIFRDTYNGDRAIGVAIAKDTNNALTAVEGGLFVPKTVVPTYTIEQVAVEGFAASYRLKQTIGDTVSYIGDTINIAKDLVLHSATLETVTKQDVPYVGAAVGDPYLKMVFNAASVSDLYIPVKGLVDTYTAGSGIEIINNRVSVKLAENTHGLIAVDGALALSLTTREADGAMSKEDKLVLDSIPYVYTTRKYDITDTPVGTLIDYRDREIRVMCPAETKFTKQSTNVGSSANTRYMALRAYAPDNAVSFKEGDHGVAMDGLHTFDGVDEFGRRCAICWLPLATYDEASNTWIYYGKDSTEAKYIGWDYCVEWYDAEGHKIGYDSVRINLSNESCHYNNKPYYLADYATVAEVEALRGDMESTLFWSEL
jgi:hypothetical protein